jgi:hypothetical protein
MVGHDIAAPAKTQAMPASRVFTSGFIHLSGKMRDQSYAIE